MGVNEKLSAALAVAEEITTLQAESGADADVMARLGARLARLVLDINDSCSAGQPPRRWDVQEPEAERVDGSGCAWRRRRSKKVVADDA